MISSVLKEDKQTYIYKKNNLRKTYILLKFNREFS